MKEVVVAVVVAVAALLLVESGDSKTISKDANKFVYLEDVPVNARDDSGDIFETHFATERTCHSLTPVRYTKHVHANDGVLNTVLKSDHWTVMLYPDLLEMMKGSTRFSAEVVEMSNGGSQMVGDKITVSGTPKQVVKQVCEIASKRGGSTR